ncbi:hypothetical protein BJF79_31180 [Actinomadura sp. CNU-125]|nr:hypothetical protein BJF79_31180 [Actinomadura sp. CNU-125]
MRGLGCSRLWGEPQALAGVHLIGVDEGRDTVGLVEVLVGFEDGGVSGAGAVGAAGDAPQGVAPFDGVRSLVALLVLPGVRARAAAGGLLTVLGTVF